MKGYVASDSLALLPQFIEAVAADFESGRLTMIETIVDGIERAPQAFIDILRGGGVGAQVVKLA
jgi:hypothetical protein